MDLQKAPKPLATTRGSCGGHLLRGVQSPVSRCGVTFSRNTRWLYGVLGKTIWLNRRVREHRVDALAGNFSSERIHFVASAPTQTN